MIAAASQHDVREVNEVIVAQRHAREPVVDVVFDEITWGSGNGTAFALRSSSRTDYASA